MRSNYDEISDLFAAYEERNTGQEDPDFLTEAYETFEGLIRNEEDDLNMNRREMEASDAVGRLYTLSKEEGFINGFRYAVKLLLGTSIL